MNPLPLPLDEVDPKYLLDWLVIQHTCEWCNGDIEAFAADENTTVTPQRQWRCREVKKNGYVSKHWKHWLVCRKCSAPADFARWVFPIIKEIMPEHMALLDIIQVQPMAQPQDHVMYMDYIHGPAPDQPNRNDRVYAKGAITYKKWKLA